jgi:hypothetical protein
VGVLESVPNRKGRNQWLSPNRFPDALHLPAAR